MMPILNIEQSPNTKLLMLIKVDSDPRHN